MIDIHANVLPGVDDGPETMEESLDLLALPEQNGISHIAATPHFWGMMDESKSNHIMSVYSHLKKSTEQAGISVKIHLALEIFITPDFATCLKFPCGSYFRSPVLKPAFDMAAY